MKEIKEIKDRLSDHRRPFIVAEIAQAHDGSLGMCHAYIDALADAGVDAIKFQTHIASAESTLDEQFRIKFSFQDATRYEYWRRMEFSEEQWAELKAHAEAKGLAFLSTPFSVEAVGLLERIGVQAWKVGSGDTLAGEMLDAILATRKPIIVSTGMSPWCEIDELVRRLRDSGVQHAVMQCTSKYPTPLSDVGLNNLTELRDRYGCRVGLSDHSGSMSPSLAAIARGFGLIEVHATFDKRMFGPDVSSSLTIEQIAGLARFARDLATLDANPVDKDAMSEVLSRNKELFGRSVGYRTALVAGHVIGAGDLVAKKPGSGIPWCNAGDFIGRKLTKDVTPDRLMKIGDLE